MTLRRILKEIGLGERRCYNCRQPFFPDDMSWETGDNLLCQKCSNNLVPYNEPCCKLCGLPRQMDNGSGRREDLCFQCRENHPPWSGRAFYGLYEGDLRNLLLRFKFQSDLALARLLANFLLKRCMCLPKADFLVAIPQTSKRLGERGYNQAYELARAFSSLSGIKLNYNILQRVKPGMPQEGLSAQERRKNTENAFQVKKKLQNAIIWLVDDILTTGSTCNAASNALLQGGAREVHLLFVARTTI